MYFSIVSTTNYYMEKLEKRRKRARRAPRINICLTNEELNTLKDELKVLSNLIRKLPKEEQADLNEDIWIYAALMKGITKTTDINK